MAPVLSVPPPKLSAMKHHATSHSQTDLTATSVASGLLDAAVPIHKAHINNPTKLIDVSDLAETECPDGLAETDRQVVLNHTSETLNTLQDNLFTLSDAPHLSRSDKHSCQQKTSTSLPVPLILAKGQIAIQDPLRVYLRKIGAFPLLNPEEELDFARRVRDHQDDYAAYRLVTSHLRLVVKIAMEFQQRWMQNILDLIQEGNMGLMRAVQKFDPERGIKFSYYATFWIKAYILKFIIDNWRMVKIGTTQTQRKLFYNLNKERRRLQSLGFEADIATLSGNLKVSVEEIDEMDQRLGSHDLSLDIAISDNSNTTRLDLLPALTPNIERSVAQKEISRALQEQLSKIMASLSDKELDILERRLLSDQPATLREIGEAYNITRERVRQLETRLLQKIRNHFSREINDFSKDWIL
ncbi:RNA polymerase sigma-32 factor [Desulfovibrionales bacterium]